MLSQSTAEAHNVHRLQMSFRVPAGFMKQSRASVEEGAGWDCLLQPPDPGGTHKIVSAREEAPASLSIFSVLAEKSDVVRMCVQFKIRCC